MRMTCEVMFLDGETTHKFAIESPGAISGEMLELLDAMMREALGLPKRKARVEKEIVTIPYPVEPYPWRFVREQPYWEKRIWCTEQAGTRYWSSRAGDTNEPYTVMATAVHHP